MCLRDGEEGGANLFPAIYRLVVEVCPVKIVVSIEASRSPGIGKVEHLLGVHRHEDLHQGEEAREDALVAILLDLVCGLHRRHFTTFQLYMDEGHSIDEQE